MSLMHRVHRTLESTTQSRAAGYVRLLLFLLIGINVVAAALETLPALPELFKKGLLIVELVSLPVFVLEYAARIWSAPADPRYASPIVGRLKYAVTPMALLDLAAILPIIVGPASGLRFLRIVRLARLARVMKITRYSNASRLLYQVVRERRADIGSALGVIALLVLVGAALAYYAERGAQPTVFSSIPRAIWWAVVTVTTVGYGDMYPITVAGKIVGGLVAILGIGAVAIPTAILGAGFLTAMSETRARICPTCGTTVSG